MISYCNQHGIDVADVTEHYVNHNDKSIHKIVLANGDVHIFCNKTLIRLN